MKQSKGPNGVLKPEHKKTGNARMGPTTDLNSQVPPSETDWGRYHHLVWGPTHRRATKEGSKVTHHILLGKTKTSMRFAAE